MTRNYPIKEGSYQSGKWTWIFPVCSALHNVGVVETEIALRAFRHHMRNYDVKLHVLYADPVNEKMKTLIKSAEPDLYLEQSHNFGKMGNLDILIRTVKTELVTIAHCDTIMVTDDVLSWPRAVFDTHPEVCFIYPPDLFGGFCSGWHELNPCCSYICCLRTEVFHNSGISFGAEYNTIRSGIKLPAFEGVGGYVETPKTQTEAAGHVYFELIRRFGVEAVMVWPYGFVVERVSAKPPEFLKNAKAVHLGLVYWPLQEFRNREDSPIRQADYNFVLKRREVVLKLLKKYRELTPDIPVIDYKITDSVGVIK